MLGLNSKNSVERWECFYVHMDVFVCVFKIANYYMTVTECV